MTTEKIFKLPNMPFEINQLNRVISFDTEIFGGYMHFLEGKKEDLGEIGKYNLYLFPLDVWEIRTSFWADLFHITSQSAKIRETAIPISVTKSCYINIGKGKWSNNLNYVLIMPPTVERLPPFFRQIEIFQQWVEQRSVEGSLITAQRKTIRQQREAMHREDRLGAIKDTGDILTAVKELLKADHPIIPQNKEKDDLIK